MDVHVNTMLSTLESSQLDLWMAAHAGEIDRVEIHHHEVAVRAASGASSTALRQAGRLVDALNEALLHLRSA
jgi:hypothetical protein